MTSTNVWLAALCGTIFAPIVTASNNPALSPDHLYFTVAGVGALMSSSTMTQQYLALPAGTFVPSINNMNLNYGTGGIQAGVGYQYPVNESWGLQSAVQYLYLAPRNRQVSPLFNTTAFQSVFLTNIGVQTVTINAGLTRHLIDKFSVYADAGLGVAILSAYSELATDSSVLDVVESHTNIPNQFTWQAGGGVKCKVSAEWGVDFGVHYVQFGNLNHGSFAESPSLPGGDNFKSNNLSAVLFSFGVRYSMPA